MSRAVISIQIVTRLRGGSKAPDARSNHGKKGDTSVSADRVSDDERLEQRYSASAAGRGGGVASDCCSAQCYDISSCKLCPSVCPSVCVRRRASDVVIQLTK